MGLKTYREKRNFKKTAEPKGKRIETTKKKPKKLFVVQKHAASHLHYDFRLELNGVLLSWAVPKGPCLDPAAKRLAVHVEDHPLEYGNFEGIIPKGQYGGGTVMLWDKGTWKPEEENPEAAYRKGSMTFSLQGKKLKGKWKLLRMNRNDKTWLLIKLKDDYAQAQRDYDVTLKKPDSVKTDLSIEEIAKNYGKIWGKKGEEKRKPPAKIKKKTLDTANLSLKSKKFPSVIFPQLATWVEEPPTGKEWLHEIKFDGYRILAFKKNNKTQLFTRRHHDWTKKFSSVANAINALPAANVILDGEVVVLDKSQHSNFQLLQNSIKESKPSSFIYYVFDLLYYDKYNLMELGLLERKNLLHQLVPFTDGKIIRYSDHVAGSGQKIFHESCKLGLEGIVSKDMNSPYVQRRGKNWLKVKCVNRQEFIICGFTKAQGQRKFFGALILGAYNKLHQLIYHGRVGTGFTEATLKSLHQLFSKHISRTSPFNPGIKIPGSSQITWLKPVLIAEIEFSEWTKDDILRAPSFKGLRHDKPAKSVTKEIKQ